MKFTLQHIHKQIRWTRSELVVSRVVVLIALISPALVQASEFYASPQGDPTGDGTIQHPWDLQTALNQTGKIQPGDTLWLRGGRYVYPNSAGSFVSTLQGSNSAPITVRNYSGEHVSIDGHGMYAALLVNGSYTWYWGLEILDSAPVRETQNTFDFGVGVYGPGNKFINVVVHDTAEGFSAFEASPDTEIYGSLVYYNGFINPAVAGGRVNFGHGMYLQNLTGLKTIDDNIIFDNAAYGMQIYGSVNASLIGFRIDGNVAFNSSSWAGLSYGYNYIIENGKDRSDIQFANNYSFFPVNAAAGQNLFGQDTPGKDISITNSILAGGYSPMEMHNQIGPVSFSGNRVFAAQGLALVYFDKGAVPSTSQYTWNQNSYYGNNAFLFSGGSGTFDQWRAATGFDSASTFSSSAPAANWIYIRPNRYEPKRANIVVYNWTGADHVSVDLSSVLTAGDNYVVQDAQNFFGPAVAQGIYNGQQVQLPMNETAKAPLRGYPTPAHTDSHFQVFVVLPAGAAVAVPVEVVLSPTQATIAQGASQAFTAAVVGSANSGVTWTLNPKLGSISADGVYTAPASVSSAQNVTLTATSLADPSASATVKITLLPPPPVVAGESFITSQTLGKIRNDYDGWVGFHLIVSSTPLKIAGLGRLCAPGNTEVHALKVVNSTTGQDVPGSQTSVFMGGCTPGQFSYGPVWPNITLAAGGSYYIVSQEHWNGDKFYDFDTVVGSSAAGSVADAVYGNWTTVGHANNSYGPLDLKLAGSGRQSGPGRGSPRR
ncbi:MAG TPA: hypothetical protein VKX49_18000 [Bryobacteraceae bacterium]|nr:hypothetical protein [Bryobacteraceae bacterium]